METESCLELCAVFESGQLRISRKDGQPISLITHEELSSECFEIVEYGSSGNAVKALQALLNCHGQHLEVDGVFGSLTQTALIIYQDSVKLPATGVADLLVWSSLIGR